MRKPQLPKRFAKFPKATGVVGEDIARYNAGEFSARQLAGLLLKHVGNYQPPTMARSKSITFNAGAVNEHTGNRRGQ